MGFQGKDTRDLRVVSISGDICSTTGTSSLFVVVWWSGGVWQGGCWDNKK